MSEVNDKRYTRVAIILHWMIAFLILLQIASGVWMTKIANPDQAYLFTTFQLHKTFGLIVLALSCARIIWKLFHPGPPLPDGMTPFERFAAEAAHWLFYGAMFAIPLSGWLMVSVSATGIPTFFFMIEALPFFHLPIGTEWSAEQKHAAEGVLKEAHFILTVLTVLLLFAHVGAALKHQFIAKDNILARMIASKKSQPQTAPKPMVGVVAFGLSALILGAGLFGGQFGTGSTIEAVELSNSEPSGWDIDYENSTLGFSLVFQNRPVTASFATWQGSVNFDPDALQTSNARVEIASASVTINDGYLNGQATSDDGFAASAFPTIVFESTAIRSLGDQNYEMDGQLTLKDITAPLTIAFSFEESDGSARVTGSSILDRREFNMGMSSAPDEQWLAFSVDLQFEILAQRTE